MIGSNLRFGKSISSPFIDPSPAKDRLSLLITYVKSNFNSHVVTIKKESVDAQTYKFVLRGKHLRARLISSPHLRYIFLRRGGWTDRSMVQSRLSGHGGRVLAAPRRLRLAFPDSVRRRPDAATVGRSARSGHQSASSEPANLSLSLSLALSRARRGARARAAASSRHTRTSTHRNTCTRTYVEHTRARQRARTCTRPSLSLHPTPPSVPPRRAAILRGEVSIQRTTREGVRVPGSSLAAAVRSQTSTRQARGVRTYARTHARNTTDHVQGPRGSFLLFSRRHARYAPRTRGVESSARSTSFSSPSPLSLPSSRQRATHYTGYTARTSCFSHPCTRPRSWRGGEERGASSFPRVSPLQLPVLVLRFEGIRSARIVRATVTGLATENRARTGRAHGPARRGEKGRVVESC